MSIASETTFTWTIYKFYLAPHLTGQYLESPVFSIGKNSKFSLLLYPRGSVLQDYVSLFLKRHSDDVEEEIYLTYAFSLNDGSGKCIETDKRNFARFHKGTMEGNRKLCRRSLLFGSTKDNFFPDKLTVLCSIWPNSFVVPYFLHTSNNIETLSQDYAALLETGIHSDLIIEVEEEQFRTHRVILEARCPELVKQLMETERPNVNCLPNTQPSVFRNILYYVYTGNFKSTENLEHVLAAANEYKLADLKDLLFPYPSSISAKTVIEFLRLSFWWNVPDFKNFSRSNNELSYFLVADNIPEKSWMKVSLYVKKLTNCQKNTFLKFQKLGSDHTGAVYFKILASDQKELTLLTESVNLFQNGNFVVPFDVGEDSAKMLVNGDLKLRFDIQASTHCGESTLQEVAFSNSQMPFNDCCGKCILYKELLHFYKTMKTGDVTLNIGPHMFTVHKAVLCSRSEVFHKMFQHDSLESRTNSVNIDDVDEDTMECLLMYMYCGGIHANMKLPLAVKLYAAADKYQLLLLKEVCSKYLKLYLDSENVGDLLLLADAHSDEGLKESVHTFITNNANQIFHSQRGLKALENRGDLYQGVVNVLLQCVAKQGEQNKK